MLRCRRRVTKNFEPTTDVRTWPFLGIWLLIPRNTTDILTFTTDNFWRTMWVCYSLTEDTVTLSVQQVWLLVGTAFTCEQLNLQETPVSERWRSSSDGFGMCRISCTRDIRSPVNGITIIPPTKYTPGQFPNRQVHFVDLALSSNARKIRRIILRLGRGLSR